MPISDAVAQEYLKRYGELPPGYTAPKPPTPQQSLLATNAARDARLFSLTGDAADSTSYAQQHGGLMPGQRTMPKDKTAAQLLSDKKARAELGFINRNASPEDSLTVAGAEEYKRYQNSLKNKPSPRSFTDASTDFTDRIKKDRGLLGDTDTNLTDEDIGGNELMQAIANLQKMGFMKGAPGKGFAEGTPEFDATTGRITANQDSLKMIPIAKQLNFKSFSGTPDSYVEIKTEFEGALGKFNAIHKSKNLDAAKKWLFDETGGQIDMPMLVNKVKELRGR
jgi:hypothetical protein